jgi:hypothetical protein
MGGIIIVFKPSVLSIFLYIWLFIAFDFVKYREWTAAAPTQMGRTRRFLILQIRISL